MATLENANGLNPQQVRPKPRDSPSSRPRPPPRPTPSPVWRKRRYRALSTVAARSCAFSPPTPRARRYVSTSFAHLDPVLPSTQVPALVMRSVENARSAGRRRLRAGHQDDDSTDQLCSKVVAPPTVHGLAMRVLSDAYVKKGELESAKAALEKGLALCKPHDGRAGMPPFMRADLNGRMGDLLMALGEIHRTEGDAKGACRRMRQAIERFHVLGQNEFVAATHIASRSP